MTSSNTITGVTTYAYGGRGFRGWIYNGHQTPQRVADSTARAVVKFNFGSEYTGDNVTRCLRIRGYKNGTSDVRRTCYINAS